MYQDDVVCYNCGSRDIDEISETCNNCGESIRYNYQDFYDEYDSWSDGSIQKKCFKGHSL